MRVTIIGINPPRRAFCRPDGTVMDNVRVGVQIGREPAQLMGADEPQPIWEVAVEVVQSDAALDFRGPAVHGKRGDRFIYLTWGNVGADGEFEMFRRAKLMLDRVDRQLVETAATIQHLVARVDLTGTDGGPRCARVDPPAVEWSAQDR